MFGIGLSHVRPWLTAPGNRLNWPYSRTSCFNRYALGGAGNDHCVAGAIALIGAGLAREPVRRLARIGKAVRRAGVRTPYNGGAPIRLACGFSGGMRLFRVPSRSGGR